MIRTSIDIGSNSILLLSVEWNNKILRELLNCSHITSLGKELDQNKSFHPDSMQATLEALSEYKIKLEKIKVNPVHVFVTATEAARVATNASEFFLKIKNTLGFNVQIISCEQEAYFTALGVVSGIDNKDKDLVIMDIGGASTELIKVQINPFKIVSSISLPVGSVRGTDWKKSGEFDLKMREILSHPIKEYQTEMMICVAGSMTSLATIFLGKKEFNDKDIDGIEINFEEFKIFKTELQKQTSEELLKNYPFLGKRAPVVAAGAEVGQMILEKLEVQSIRVSTRGLRYGVVTQGHL